MFPGAFLPLHHLHRVHHAAVQVVVRCGAERHLLPVPHYRHHSAPHHLQQRAHSLPSQPGDIGLIQLLLCFRNTSYIRLQLLLVFGECVEGFKSIYCVI